jgi:hypothetical protein
MPMKMFTAEHSHDALMPARVGSSCLPRNRQLSAANRIEILKVRHDHPSERCDRVAAAT